MAFGSGLSEPNAVTGTMTGALGWGPGRPGAGPRHLTWAPDSASSLVVDCVRRGPCAGVGPFAGASMIPLSTPGPLVYLLSLEKERERVPCWPGRPSPALTLPRGR